MRPIGYANMGSTAAAASSPTEGAGHTRILRFQARLFETERDAEANRRASGLSVWTDIKARPSRFNDMSDDGFCCISYVKMRFFKAVGAQRTRDSRKINAQILKHGR